MNEIKHGDGFNYTFGESKAAVNLIGNILPKPEYQVVKSKVMHLLSKQIKAMRFIMDVKDKGVREATLKMWHDRFSTLLTDLPEVVMTHTRCVETGWYRQLLKESKEK